jgi:hypothetical protein
MVCMVWAMKGRGLVSSVQTRSRSIGDNCQRMLGLDAAYGMIWYGVHADRNGVSYSNLKLHSGGRHRGRGCTLSTAHCTVQLTAASYRHEVEQGGGAGGDVRPLQPD